VFLSVSHSDHERLERYGMQQLANARFHIAIIT
jgi:hypothetical protein